MQQAHLQHGEDALQAVCDLHRRHGQRLAARLLEVCVLRHLLACAVSAHGWIRLCARSWRIPAAHADALLHRMFL